MKVGMIGLGKLGHPVAQAMQEQHDVMGWDVDPRTRGYNDMDIVWTREMVHMVDFVFVAVQTPHQKQFDGTHLLTRERADFDYEYLLDALTEIDDACVPITVAVISTCLPGTLERIAADFPNLNIVYNPMFVGMGSVIEDFKHPEFVLLGGLNTSRVREFYEQTYEDVPIIETDYTTAEAIKVSYNTFITAKTVLANTWGQICHELGIDVDELYDAWALATDRLISPRYLKAGMSDGGPCHPRDNIAMSWLSNELGLPHNYFDGLMTAREQHEMFLADLIPKGEVVIFGRSFKPEAALEDGSAALLLANILWKRQVIHEEDPVPGQVNFIATEHERYKDVEWPKGSTVIDPFGIIDDQEGVDVIRVGRK